MLKLKDKKDCTGCSACYSICPTKAIAMQEDNEGFVYPVIDETKCIKCGLCKKICPCINNKDNNNLKEPTMLAAWSLDFQNKETSSSGGCFYELAKYVIKQGGLVVGAGFDKGLNIVHKIVDNMDNLFELKGSKYVQSRIGDCYINVKENLDKDKIVLFVGTPCQVAGLYAFLKNKQYNNLYTADLICHGVPSTKVYRKYLEELSNKYKSNPISLTFRDKSNGWKKYKVKISFNNSTYIKNASEDIYMRAFLSNICLRPSCYECKFSKLPRVADITLGDFWGVKNVDNSLDDDTGTSELVINSEKGKELLSKIEKNVFVKEVELQDGIKYNPCLVGSVTKPKNREQFFIDLDKNSLSKLEKKYFPKRPIVIRIASKIMDKLYNMINK